MVFFLLRVVSSNSRGAPISSLLQREHLSFVGGQSWRHEEEGTKKASRDAFSQHSAHFYLINKQGGEIASSYPCCSSNSLLARLLANQQIVLMTSQLGARRGYTGSLGLYGDSKAALNDAFRAHALAWGQSGCIAIVMHPGWVRTDMGGAGAPLSVKESVRGMWQVIARLTPADHGRFWTWEGREHPW